MALDHDQLHQPNAAAQAQNNPLGTVVPPAQIELRCGGLLACRLEAAPLDLISCARLGV